MKQMMLCNVTILAIQLELELGEEWTRIRVYLICECIELMGWGHKGDVMFNAGRTGVSLIFSK